MVEERLGPFFQVGVLFRRLWLGLRALIYLKHLKLMAAHLICFCSCSLHKAFQLLDKETNPYGETPYSTLDRLAKRFRILSKDVVYDLGSGRGLGLFWWSIRVGCRAYGVENYGPFVTRAQWIQKRLALSRVTVLEADFLEVDLSGATVIYLYGTALSDEMIHKLITRFEQLSSRVKIITVSYPLADYSASFQTVDQCKALFAWGRTDVYLNKHHLS